MQKRGRPFEPGNQFGRGRPRGSRNQKNLLIQELLDTHAAPLLRKAVREALKGDVPLMRTLLGHILPRRGDLPTNVGPLRMSTLEDLSQSSEAILEGVMTEKITLKEARDMFNLIETRRRVIEMREFDERLRAAEKAKANE